MKKTLLACIITPIVFMFFDKKINAAELTTLIIVLVSVSGAIFSIMSIWLGFLYPNVLKTLKERNSKIVNLRLARDDQNRLKAIVSIIINSSVTMGFSIVALIALGVSKNSLFFIQDLILQGVQLLTLFFSGVQIWAIAGLISINLSFVTKIEAALDNEAANQDV